ncbi:hypothetical protein CR513_45364, partial [Mucuna pruriens]
MVLRDNGEVDSDSSTQEDTSSSYSREDYLSETFPYEGDILMVRRLMSSLVREEAETQREIIFHSKFLVLVTSESSRGGSAQTEGTRIGVATNSCRPLAPTYLRAGRNQSQHSFGGMHAATDRVKLSLRRPSLGTLEMETGWIWFAVGRGCVLRILDVLIIWPQRCLRFSEKWEVGSCSKLRICHLECARGECPWLVRGFGQEVYLGSGELDSGSLVPLTWSYQRLCPLGKSHDLGSLEHDVVASFSAEVENSLMSFRWGVTCLT